MADLQSFHSYFFNGNMRHYTFPPDPYHVILHITGNGDDDDEDEEENSGVDNLCL